MLPRRLGAAPGGVRLVWVLAADADAPAALLACAAPPEVCRLASRIAKEGGDDKVFTQMRGCAKSGAQIAVRVVGLRELHMEARDLSVGTNVRLEARVELLHGDMKGVGGAVQGLNRQLHRLQERAQIGVIAGHRVEARQAIEDAPAPLRQVGRNGRGIHGHPAKRGELAGGQRGVKGVADGLSWSERGRENAREAPGGPQWSTGRAGPAFGAKAPLRPEWRRL
ncbi:hypothetical protein Emag_000017 [Eimeria magna]